MATLPQLRNPFNKFALYGNEPRVKRIAARSGRAASTRRARSIARIVSVAITIATVAAAGLAAEAGSHDRVLEVTVESSHVSVRAHAARLSEVLEAIGRESGVRMVLRGDLDAPITDSFVGLSLDQAVRRLSRWHSVVLVYDQPSGSAEASLLTEVWVAAVSDSPGGPASTAQPVQRDDASAAARPATDVSRPVVDPTSLLAHHNPAVRVRGVQEIVRQQGESVSIDALRSMATRDPAAEVRVSALRALSTLDRADAGDVLQAAALEEPDPAIRVVANQALRRWRGRSARSR
jgi:hypothetical protein